MAFVETDGLEKVAGHLYFSLWIVQRLNAPVQRRAAQRTVHCNRLLGAMFLTHGCCLEHIWSKTFLCNLDCVSVDLESYILSPSQLRRDEGRAAAAERIENELPRQRC